jgi:hypothetical protein
MYEKQNDDSVNQPDDTQMTMDDLPPTDTKRWVATRKAAVVRGVNTGLITAEDAIAMYDLSYEELESWQRAISDHGIDALRATAIQKFRG